MKRENNSAATDSTPVLSVKDLSVSFRMYTQGTQQHDLKVITSLNVDIRAGEILAVVGSSGSGKSILASAIMGLLPGNAKVEGEMYYCGEPLTAAAQARLRGREMSLIPQSVAYLDPLMRVDKQVQGTQATEQQQKSIFKRFKLKSEVGKMYPHQLSGGMARRVLVSTAVINGSRLIIADEPTPGLSVALARDTLQCFRELADEGAAVMLITHDIDLALSVADRIAVFYAGTTVEVAPVSDFRDSGSGLRHPYSKAFYDALPQTNFRAIPGTQPYAGSLPKGCVFSPRCELCSAECMNGNPDMRELRGGTVRCFHAD